MKGFSLIYTFNSRSDECLAYAQKAKRTSSYQKNTSAFYLEYNKSSLKKYKTVHMQQKSCQFAFNSLIFLLIPPLLTHVGFLLRII